jgi:hypothetical protein
MENELMLNVESIVVRQGSIQFNQFDDIKSQAEMLADEIHKVEVTEDNIKHSKKLLAAVNKKVKELEDRRISIKKEMLEPYSTFEAQVKEIVNIVKSADSKVREQVKYLEDFERLQKEEAISEIFEKRKALYTLGELIPFEDFLKPKHLNKTTSLEAVEKEMIDFLEQTEKDYGVIATMPEPENLTSAYLKTYDLATAMTQIRQEQERREQIEKSKAAKKVDKSSRTFRFTIFDEKDKTMVQMFLDQNKVKYDFEQI